MRGACPLRFYNFSIGIRFLPYLSILLSLCAPPDLSAFLYSCLKLFCSLKLGLIDETSTQSAAGLNSQLKSGPSIFLKALICPCLFFSTKILQSLTQLRIQYNLKSIDCYSNCLSVKYQIQSILYYQRLATNLSLLMLGVNLSEICKPQNL